MGHIAQRDPCPGPAGSVGGEGDRAQRHAVKGAHQGKDVLAFFHLAGQLQSGLHSVGAGGAGELQLIGKPPGLEDLFLIKLDKLPLGACVHVQGVHHPVLLQILHQPVPDQVRVVAVVQGPGPAEEVNILPPLLVIEKGPLGGGEHRGEAAAVGPHLRLVALKGLCVLRTHGYHPFYHGSCP